MLKALAREGMPQSKWRKLRSMHECTGYPSDDEQEIKEEYDEEVKVLPASLKNFADSSD